MVRKGDNSEFVRSDVREDQPSAPALGILRRDVTDVKVIQTGPNQDFVDILSLMRPRARLDDVSPPIDEVRKMRAEVLALLNLRKEIP